MAEGQPVNSGRTVEGQATGAGPEGEIVAGRSVEGQVAVAERTVEGQAAGATNRHPSRPTEQSEGGPRRHPQTGRFQ